MGKVSKWLKALLGFKKTTRDSSSSTLHQNSQPSPSLTTKSRKKKRSCVKSYTDKDLQHYHLPDKSLYYDVSTSIHGKNDDAGADVRSSLTTNIARPAAVITSNSVVFRGEEWAAVLIQSHFRAYLSRRALRALKGLVKIQALVRGHIVRKQTADMLRRMQALIRAQSRACAGRSQVFESPHLSAKTVQFLHHGPATPDKIDHVIRARSMKNDQIKRNSSKSSTPTKIGINHMGCRMDKKQGSFARTDSIDDKKIDNILEIDTGKPYVNPIQRNLFYSTDLSLYSDQFSFSMDETCFSSANNSPQLLSASSKGGRLSRGPFTPTKSTDGTRSCSSGYSDYPNYMSYTEAAKAKTRSMSAPKLRPKYDMFSSTKKYSIHGHGESRINLQRSSAFYANFTSKAYPGSGRLEKLGMPVKGDSDEFSHGPWQIY